MESHTLPEKHPAHAATLLSSPQPPSHDGNTQVVTGAEIAIASLPLGGSARSTILPRVEFVGEVPRLVVDARDRFEAARVLGRLDHPNIVPIHDVGIDPDGRYFYVMKYVDGETLEHVIDKLIAGDAEYHRKYPFERRTEVFLQLLRGVEYAHAQGVLHRDLKPANVMIGRFGEVVVMDWGLARGRDDVKAFPVDDKHRTLTASPAAKPRADKLQTMEGALLGTPAYMSPEQARGEVASLDERSDVYALAVMFHELLTLEHYLASKSGVAECVAGVLRDPVPPAYTVENPHQGRVPVELAHFITHGVGKAREERYPSVTAMIERLQAIRDGKVPVECGVTFVKRMGAESMHAVDRNFKAAFVVAGMATALGLVGLATVVWRVVAALR